MNEDNLLPTPDTGEVYLQQYAMYYYDPETNAVGWQFGLPPSKDLGRQDLDVHIVLQDGTVRCPKAFNFQEPNPEKGRPGLPTWAWTPVKLREGSIVYAHVVAPQEKKGSVPVSRLPRNGRILTPTGVSRSNRKETFYDLPFDIYTPTYDSGEYLLHIGRVAIGEVKIQSGKVNSIRPIQPSYQLDLWTSHLSRVLRTKTGFPHGVPERN